MASKLLINFGLIASMLVSFGIGFYANHTARDKVCKEQPITTTIPVEPPLPPPPPPPTLPAAVKCPICDKNQPIKYVVIKEAAKQIKSPEAQHKSHTIVQQSCYPKIEYRVLQVETKSKQIAVKGSCPKINEKYGLQLLQEVK